MWKFFIRVISCFILNKEKRKAFRKAYLYPGIFINKGIDNQLLIFKNGRWISVKKVPGAEIAITGDHNRIEIGENSYFKNAKIEISHTNYAHVKIGSNCQLNNFLIHFSKGENQTFSIGDYSSTGGISIMLPSHTSCYIGNNCMFSKDICIWAGDGHTLFNYKTGNVLNKKEYTIRIGNYCWVGWGTALLKNTVLPDYTIVGMQSVVTKKFTQKYTVLAGNPAKIIKKDVAWDRADPYEFNVKSL